MPESTRTRAIETRPRPARSSVPPTNRGHEHSNVTAGSRGAAGAAGLSDRRLGPGATGSEIALGIGSGAAAALALPALALHGGAGWSPAQILLAGLLAFDLVGGVVVNASTPARRFSLRSASGTGQSHDRTPRATASAAAGSLTFCG